jgi:caffeoyl-CoA O-methyltransferase
VSKFTALTDELHSYAVEHGAREDEVLRRLREETEETVGELSVMQIAPDQGALMALLARAIGARRALELGTFTGYSAICIARALPAGGTLVACDVSEEWTAIARRYFDEAGVADRIDLRIAPAAETLAALPSDERFDFAFIDADKEGYPGYWEECVRLVRPGGLILVDNVLAAGRVLADPGDREPQVEAIMAVNETIAADERVEIAMTTVADGLTIALRRAD